MRDSHPNTESAQFKQDKLKTLQNRLIDRVCFERDTCKYALECIVNDNKIGNEELGVAAEWYRTIARTALEQCKKADA